MKKIVALVLSLVMALSLCTVAFGVNGTELRYLDSNDNAISGDAGVVKNVELTSVKAHTNKDGSGYVAYYVCKWFDYVEYAKFTKDDDVKMVRIDDGPALWSVDQESYEVTVDDNGNWKIFKNYEVVNTTYLIPCEQADAQYAIHKSGSITEFVFEASNSDAAAYYETATAQAATKAKPNCTTSQFFYDGYLCDDGHFYVEKPATTGFNAYALNVDGKIVVAYDVTDDSDYVVWASHVFAEGVKNDKMGYDVAKCLVCGSEFACTNNDVVAKNSGYKISTMFEYSATDAANVYNENKYANGYDFAWGQTYAGNYKFCWQLKAGTTEEIGTADKADTETKTEGVESAKTFDAGIAMYVGMSLMSVAGTAVVIGKKKEF